MTDLSKAFKRINFFRGFLATEEDFNDATAYHVEKHRLHNRLCHGLGIIPGFLGDLRVQARGKGELAVEVLPGIAVDGNGNEILISDPEIKAINPLDYKLPQTIYIVAKHVEELTDFITYKENLEFKGHRRVSELSRIEAQIVEPDAADGIELARVQLAPGVRRITDAKNPEAPGDNEIDLRFSPKAGVVGSRLSTTFRNDLIDLTQEMQEIYAFLFQVQGISTAADVDHALITLRMLFHSHLVDAWNLYPLLGDILRLQWTFIEDVEANYGQFSSRKEFVSLKRHIELLESYRKEGRRDQEFLDTFLAYERKGVENMRAIFSERLKKVVKEAVADTPLAQIAEKLKVHSKAFKKTMTVEGVKLSRVDEIDILEPESEKAHSFKIIDARDKYRSRQKLKYPDGTVVEDVGVAYEGGRCEFKLTNVVPGHPIILLVRMDYVRGDWEADIDVNGRKAGTMRCAGEDVKYRWRNWPFLIEGDFVNDVELTITQTPTTEERDINFFHVWAYQPAGK